MVFTRDSFSVQFWIKRINDGKATREEVPSLFNLKEVVTEVINAT